MTQAAATTPALVMPESANGIEVRLARTPGEIEAAQRLRYQVFYDEWGAQPDLRMRQSRRDIDAHDAAMDHMIVIDHARSPAQGQVIGNYRLLCRHPQDAPGHFYSSHEFDLGTLLSSDLRLLELGRSCVLREYRSMPVLQLLWQAIVGYVADHRIEVMFGCASLRGTDPNALREQLSYLHHYHLAPPALRPCALGPNRTRMDLIDRSLIDPVRALYALEPIIKGYLRLGAWVGADAYIDHQFNAVDVCIVLPTAQMTRKYRRHFERVLQRKLVAAADSCGPLEVADARQVASA